MPFIEQAELDALRASAARLDALTTQPLASDPASNMDPADGLGRNALFAAIQKTRMPMILTDPHKPDNPIIFANRAFVELSGYAVDELVGRNCRFLQGTDTLPSTVDKIREAVRTRSTIAIDIVNYRKDGERFVNELYISPIFSEGGDLLYFFGSQVDITADIETRLSVQLTLIERERHVLAQIAEGVALPSVLSDLLLLVEKQYDAGVRTSILFVSKDGKHLHHGAGPSLPQAYNDAIDGIAIGEGMGSCGTVASRGTPVYANDIATDPLWVDFRELALSHGLRACWSTPIKGTDNGVLGTFAIYYDTPRTPTNNEIAAIGFITQTAALAIERHRHEIELRESDARLRALNNDLERQIVERSRERATTWTVTSELLSIIDVETGHFDRTNPAWTATLGWTPQELEGVAFASFIHPDDIGATKVALDQIRRGDPLLRFENRYRTNEGGFRWLSWVAVPFEGKIYSSARDVTAERNQASKLGEAEDALRQAQKMEAIGQLTGGVAHDFNNLLTVIRGSVDLLRRPDLSGDRRGRYIDAIGDTADRAAKLTGQLLAFARRQALKPEPFDIGQSLIDVSTMIRTLTGSRIVLETIVPDDACYVLADKGQFDTAIVNMSINARDAMDGEGRLTICVGPVSGIPAIRAQGPVAGDYLAVTITDTGSGISPENIERIFEPFYTTKGPGHGTGLGLSQVIGFAKQSDGDIRVESGNEGGTTFIMYLPRVTIDGEGAEAEVEEPITITGDGVCVLVVEDNSDVGEFAVQALDELGYSTVLALNGEEALAELGKDCDRFHIVFSDVVMPGMSGLELAQEVRRRHPHLPVILTSGYSHVLAQNGRHGFELLHKPYSIDQLSRVFRKAITWQAQR